MAAFIDELLDAMGDSNSDVGLGGASHPTKLHPYLPRTPAAVMDSAQEKLITHQVTESSAPADRAASSGAVPRSSKATSYSPLPSGNHQYLPSRKASGWEDSKECCQGRNEVASVLATSGDHEKYNQPTFESSPKLFRPPSSSHLLAYMSKGATSAPQNPPDPAQMAKEHVSMDTPLKPQVATNSLEQQNSYFQDSGKKDADLGMEKLDIDALIAALPPKAPEIQKDAPRVIKNLANPMNILEDDPDLQVRISEFLCQLSRPSNGKEVIFSGSIWPHSVMCVGDVQFCVPVR